MSGAEAVGVWQHSVAQKQQQAEQRATHPRPTKIPNPSVIDWGELIEDEPPRRRAKQVSEKSRGLA